MLANPGKIQIMCLGSNIDNSKIMFIIQYLRKQDPKSKSEVKILS